MKNIIFVLIIVFSVDTFATMYFPVGKEGANKTYSDVNKCKESEGWECFNIVGKNLEYWDLEEKQVENLDKPILRDKYKVEACSNAIDCGDKFKSLNLPFKKENTLDQEIDFSGYCDKDPGDYVTFSENKLMPGWSIYCTGVKGYEKETVKALVLNQDKKTAFDAKQAQEKVKQEALRKVQDAIAFGQSLKNEIYLINAAKGLSNNEVRAFVEEFQAIDRLLSVGAIATAKGDIEAIQVGPSISAEEKQLILDKINGFLGK